MSEYSLPKKKKFGQHFLIDRYIIDRIIALVDPRPTDHFVEIGPGAGILTRLLLAHAAVTAIELDNDLVKYLSEEFAATSRFKIIAEDVLKVDYQQFKQFPMRWIGNLPYNISTPFLLSLIAMKDDMVDGVFMLQYEVALRIVASVGSKQYGRLAVALSRFFSSDIILEVPATAFDPPPAVHSAVVRMVPKKTDAVDEVFEKEFLSVVARAFGQRRKMLRKIFQKDIQASDWQVIAIDASLRPEQLTPEDFERLTAWFLQR